LELGGKSPAIVLEDADIEEAIQGTFDGTMYNHGQNCSACTRIFVQRSLYRLCPYNCVKEKSHSHPHDTIILDQQNFVGGNENDSTQFYLKLRRTKRTNY